MTQLLPSLPEIILASNSPRRKTLLKQIGLTFKVVPSQVEEDPNLPLLPIKYAEHYARLKAQTVSEKYPQALVIGADTIVVLDDEILGKPTSAQAAHSMLKRLSNRTHTVITGVSLQWKEHGIVETSHEKTAVTFYPIPNEEINHYIKNWQPFDKAGSYGIQDWSSVWVKGIKGCYFNVVGFPLATFYQHLKKIMKKA
jgi:septum formation protein